jgi:hypothetical protein
MAISLLVLGPMLEGFGLKNGARLAVPRSPRGHHADDRRGDARGRSVGLLAADARRRDTGGGNGMIEVPAIRWSRRSTPRTRRRAELVPRVLPDRHRLGGLIGFALANWGGGFGLLAVPARGHLPADPDLRLDGADRSASRRPRTRRPGCPSARCSATRSRSPLFLLMLAMMAITTSMELGPMRWMPAVLQAVGMHGILVLVWISGWMVVLRLLATHFVERFSPYRDAAGRVGPHGERAVPAQLRRRACGRRSRPPRSSRGASRSSSRRWWGCQRAAAEDRIARASC